MTFSTNGYPVGPFYVDDTAPYHAYFKRTEPRVVFGSVDSGVPNVQRADRLTFLDLVWADAPFADSAAFVRTVAAVSAEWEASGLFTRQQRQAVLTAANRADLRP
jgi:hypothetical protein